MAKITNKQIKIFSGNTASTEATVFGSLKDNGTATFSDDPDTLQNQNYENGWNSGLILGKAPTQGDFTTLDYLETRELRYLQQQGIKEWLAGVDYYIGSIIKIIDNNIVYLYKSLTDNNLNNNPLTDNGTNWELMASDLKTVIGDYYSNITYNLHNTIKIFDSGLSTLKFFYSNSNNNKNNNPLTDDGTNWVEIKNSAGNFDVIGQFAFFARTDNPVGWLKCDGTEYTKSTFPDFWDNYLATNKLPTCTYADYTTSINNYGSCGFFAVDSVNETFKVPLIDDDLHITQALTSGNIAKYNAESLPSHIHQLVSVEEGGQGTIGGTTGFLNASSTSVNRVYTNTNYSYAGDIDNSVYQSGAKVQPDRLQYCLFVRVSNEQAPVSTAQYNGFINGLNSKTNLDGSNADFSALSTTAKNNITNCCVPDYSATISGVGNNYIAPSNGIFWFSISNWNDNTSYSIYITTVDNITHTFTNVYNAFGAAGGYQVSLNKGETITIRNTSYSLDASYFIPLKGAN